MPTVFDVTRAASVARIEIEGLRLDVAEHRHGAEQGDRLGGGEEGEARHQDLVARLDAEGAEREHQGVGAVADADRAGHAEEARERFLELLDLRAENERSAGEHRLPAALELGGDATVGAGEVEHGNRIHGRDLLVGSGSAASDRPRSPASGVSRGCRHQAVR